MHLEDEYWTLFNQSVSIGSEMMPNECIATEIKLVKKCVLNCFYVFS